MISQILRKKYPKKSIFLKLNHNNTKDVIKITKKSDIKLTQNNIHSSWKHIYDKNLFFINIPHNTYIH